jgi:hypothetical protein
VDVKDYMKYCLFVEAVGGQLEQRALDGGELPAVLKTRAPGVLPTVRAWRSTEPRIMTFAELRECLGHSNGRDLAKYYLPMRWR